MAEKSTIARPYAQAVFELAQDQGDYAVWSRTLEVLAQVVTQSDAQVFISNPRIPRETIAETVAELCGSAIDEAGKAFIRVLADNRRLNVVIEIAAHYEVLRAEAESSVKAQLVTALPTSDAQVAKLKDALEKKLGRKVELENAVDAELLGGAIIRAGDLVIDGSALGKLSKLVNELEG